MSADPDKDTACPKADIVVAETGLAEGDLCREVTEKKRKKPPRSVRFPDENQLVTKYFEPANPWQDVPTTTRAQLAADYLESCRRHNTTPIDSVLQQIRELPENSIGGGNRAARLTLAACCLTGSAPVDALEALLRRVQFRRVEVDHCEVDDEGAEAFFDMIEYYESAQVVSISGPRQFGIRGWQAACRMIKKSADLTEIEVCESALCSSHAPVLVRALRPHTCRLRALCLQRASLQGDTLLCLVIALKSNTSIRELRLPDNQLSVTDAQQLASLLRFNLNIQLLDLSNNQIQDAGVGHIADALVAQAAQTPPSAATSPLSPHHYPLGGYEARLGLAFLVLWNNQLTRNCAPHLSKALRSSQSLCVLNIGRNALGGECVRALQCGGSLVSLGLQCARLGADAARPLRDLVRQDNKLQRLDLRDNRLGVLGLQAIYDAMKENTTLTQIDLDDPEESTTLTAEDSDAATVARLTRDIAAICRRNEPPATEPERRVHRKISLTCHTTCVAKPAASCPETARLRTARLRSPAPSPAPSPAGSPIPHSHNSRFSVTRVTPERESSTESTSPSTPTRSNYCLTPSRFKVVQVAEPPSIQVHPATQKRPSSRFSVTRNYDTMYNPSPRSSPSASPTPSISPIPSASPTLGVSVASPTRVFSVSPTVMISDSAMTDVSSDLTMSSVSPTVMSDSPTPEVLSCSPVAGVCSVSSTVTIRDPTSVVSCRSTTQGVLTSASSTVDVQTSVSPTPIEGITCVLPTLEASGVSRTLGDMTYTTQSAGIQTSILPTPEILTTVSPTVMTGIPATPKVTTLFGATTMSPMICASPTILTTQTSRDLTSVSSAITTDVSLAITTSVSPSIATGVPLAITTGVSSTMSVSTSTVSIKSQVCTGYVATGVKAYPSSSFTTVPSVSPIPGSVPSISLTHGPFQNINIINIGTSQKTNEPNTRPEIHAIICSDTHIPTVSDQLEKYTNDVPAIVGTSTCPVSIPGTTPVEDIWKNYAVPVESSGDIASSILIGTPSSITMTGAAVSGTSIATLSGTTSSGIPITEPHSADKDSLITFKDAVRSRESELLFTRSEPLIKVSDIAPWPNVSNIGAESSSINIDRVRFEPRFTPAATPKTIFSSKVVPNSRFSISPMPDNFDILPNEHSDIKVKEDIPKAVAIGSQTNIAAAHTQSYTNKVPSNVEADIFMKIAELTETIGPKVVETEPKLKPNTIDLEKDDSMQLLETMTSINRPLTSDTNDPINIAACIPIFIDVASNIGPKMQEIIEIDKSLTDRSIQQILPLDYITTSMDTSDITQFTEQIKLEEQGPCIDVKSILTMKSKQPEIPAFRNDYIQNIEEIDKTGSESILKDDLRPLESNLKLLKNIAKESLVEDAKISAPDVNIASKLEHRSAEDSMIHDIDKDIYSDAKKSDTSDESVKNKTYSDVVKIDPKYKDKSEQLTHREEISDSVVKTETNLVKNSVEMSESDKVDVHIEVTVKKESVQNAAKVHSDQNKDFVNIDDIIIKKEGRTMKQIEAITEDLGNLIQEMKDITSKSRKVKSDCTVDLVSVDTNKVPGNFNRDIVLKKNKSESSLDSPDLEVSRLLNKKLVGSPFCDSSSSLEISGSSMESLNAIEIQHAMLCHVLPKPVVIQEAVESDTELDRRKDVALSTESSIESTSEVTPVNSGNLLNMSVSSNESVSPIIFGKKKKIHDSLSSLEASMSSLDSGRQEKVMVTSADSGIEYSLQHPSENKEDNSSNEGTLTHNSSLRETVKKTEQETLTSSPKRTSSLLDVPALKTKGLDRMRKISWVAPSSSFHIPRVDADKLEKPSHLEKLLSLFQHPTSLFSRGSQSDDERKSASNTPPRKDSSLTSAFWSWGSTIEKEKEDKEDSSEATDSTLSERVQVSFVDESFSKKLDSKTPSTDTDNTLSEFQSFPIQTSTEGDCKDKVTDDTTDENLVQKCLGLSLNTGKAGSNGNTDTPRASDMTDLSKPNDLNRNYEVSSDGNKNDAVDVENKSENNIIIDKGDSKDETKLEPIRPRSFAAVLKSSGSENSLDKQPSPESGQPVDKLPSKVIRGIKENISPENTLTSSMTNTKTLALELTERQVKNQATVNAVWEITNPLLEKSELKVEEIKTHSDLAPIATIEETCDEAADNTVNIHLEFIDDVATDEKDGSIERRVTFAETDKTIETVTRELKNVDVGKDALSYLIYESQDFEPDTEQTVDTRTKVEGSLAQELKEAEIKEMLDLSPELVIDEALEVPVLTAKEIKGMKSSPVVPERAKLKKSNSLEDLSQRQSEESGKSSPKTKTIVFKVPETTSPRDIPERRTKLRTMSGSSPKSLPESLNKPSPLAKMDSALKKRKKVSSLGKMAKDSLLALNMSEDEIAEYRRSYVTSVESLRSLESVSEDANSQSGTSVDSRCRWCLRTSQESLMSLDSITEDCKCGSDCEKTGRSVR